MWSGWYYYRTLELAGFSFVRRVITVTAIRIAVAILYVVPAGTTLAALGIGLWTLFFGR